MSTSNTRYVISQGCVKYQFDRLTDLVNAFTVNRFLDASKRFHLVVVNRQHTSQGTIDKPVSTILEWSGIVAYWNEVHYS